MLCVISFGFLPILFEEEVLLKENSAQILTFGNLVTKLKNTTFGPYKQIPNLEGLKERDSACNIILPLRRQK